MSRFKVGDKVRLLQGHESQVCKARAGDVYRVMCIDGHNNVELSEHPYWWFPPSKFAPVDEIPESQSYEAIGAGIGKLVTEKQRAYGDSFGKCGDVMRILYPDGVPPEKLDDALTIVRVIDKLFRIATDRDALGESPWKDIAGYALLASKRAAR